jgi:hypothetical protein
MASSPLQPAWISISWRVKESHKPPAGGEQAAGLVPPRSGISSYALRHLDCEAELPTPCTPLSVSVYVNSA